MQKQEQPIERARARGKKCYPTIPVFEFAEHPKEGYIRIRSSHEFAYFRPQQQITRLDPSKRTIKVKSWD